MDPVIAVFLTITLMALILVPLGYSFILELFFSAFSGWSWLSWLRIYGIALGIVAVLAAVCWGLVGLFVLIFGWVS